MLLIYPAVLAWTNFLSAISPTRATTSPPVSRSVLTLRSDLKALNGSTCISLRRHQSSNGILKIESIDVVFVHQSQVFHAWDNGNPARLTQNCYTTQHRPTLESDR